MTDTRTTTRGIWTGLAALGLALGCGETMRQRVQGPETPRMEGGEDPADPGASAERWTTAVEPKPLGDTARTGLDWLVETQLPSGGWGQGEESAHMGSAQRGLADEPNVADTAMAALALLRANSDGTERYAQALGRGVDFVCASVEAADDESLYVTDVRGTRVQSKIGGYVDTFLAAQLLAEAKGRLGDPARAVRADTALAKVLAKIERHQEADGGFGGQGWAPVLSQSIAGKGLQRAAQSGARVDADVLAQNFGYWAGRAEAPADAAAPGSAGVALYSSSANLAVLQDKVNTDRVREKLLREQLAADPEPEARRDLEAELGAIEAGRRAQERYHESVLDRLEDPSFVAGFGSNGGEEFLSYTNISESLVVRGDETWREWDAAMAANLDRVQNEDGSWSGHHCITGRTFCTSAALLVLMADRTPFPVEAVAQAD